MDENRLPPHEPTPGTPDPSATTEPGGPTGPDGASGSTGSPGPGAAPPPPPPGYQSQSQQGWAGPSQPGWAGQSQQGWAGWTGQPGQPRSGTDSFFDTIRRTGLVRGEQRWIGGVASGIAQRLGVDPLVVRGVLLVSIMLGGLGLIVYGLGWMLLPEQRDGRIHVQQLFRGDFDVAVLAGLAVLITGLSFPDRLQWLWWGPDTDWWRGLMWVSVIVVVVVLIVSATNNRPATGPATTLYPGGPARPATARPTGPTATAYPTAPYPAASYPHEQDPTPPYQTQQYPTQQYPAQPQQAGPTATLPRPVPPAGPVSSLPRPAAKQGPGAGSLGVVVALALIVLAALLYAERIGTFAGPVWLTAGAVWVTLLGAAIIVAGLRGRTSGGLGVLAVLSTLALLPAAALHGGPGWDASEWDGHWGRGVVGDLEHTPTDVESAERGYSMGAGDARVDLTEVPLSGDPVEVPLRVGAGELTVIVPEGVAVEAEIDVMAGEVTWLDEGQTSGMPGSHEATYESPAVRDGEEPELRLEITVGAGSVRVVEG